MGNRYVVEKDKLVRTNPFCPRCGDGVIMADKGEWWSCGKCGDRYYKSSFSFKKEDKDKANDLTLRPFPLFEMPNGSYHRADES
jgi:small subunit ribosomal protein S27Ae